ncbi:MAG: hypothetical protein KC479_05495 [Dehalococcoidia bacterium]|nr:hypothetical protein [Dehalococcoidia bacterium]
MVSWSDFAGQAPKIAGEGRKLLYQYGVPLAYLATRRKDSGLRIHPVCPIQDEGELWLLVGNHSPKKWDLLRDGQFALHAFPVAGGDDEFMLAGTATHIPDHETETRVRAALVATGATSGDDTCFRLSIERALLSLYQPKPGGGGIWPPDYYRWPARK